jgi:hypothetical protein
VLDDVACRANVPGGLPERAVRVPQRVAEKEGSFADSQNIAFRLCACKYAIDIVV